MIITEIMEQHLNQNVKMINNFTESVCHVIEGSDRGVLEGRPPQRRRHQSEQVVRVNHNIFDLFRIGKHNEWVIQITNKEAKSVAGNIRLLLHV